MKRILFAVALWTAAWPVASAAEPFSQQLTPAEFKAAGLKKLSAAELAQLNSLFNKYGRGEVEAPAPVAAVIAPTPAKDTAPVATAPLAAQLAAAEARAQRAEQDAAAAREMAEVAKAAQKSAETGLLAKAKKIFVPVGTHVEVAAVEGEVDGWFDGWSSGTTWKLKDGALWRVENYATSYDAKRVKDPRVRIYPATMSGFWIEFPDLDLRVRGRRVN